MKPVDHPGRSPPPPGLQVIGAGFGRFGTTSLTRALEILGYGPCYHMQVTMTRPGQARLWIRARAGEPVDYRRFFRAYRATVDWPACEFVLGRAQGWPPLCAFLGRPEPVGVPFPVLNDRRFFRFVLRALQVSGWLAPLVALAVLVAVVRA